MEQFSNFAQSTLSSSLDATTTSVAVTDASRFPAIGSFRVWVDDEIMTCSGRTGNVLTVTRGQEGTTAVPHSNGAAIAHGLTAAGLLNAITDRAPAVSQASLSQYTISTASGVWGDVRDDSTLTYCQLTLSAGRYLLFGAADAVLQVNGSGTYAADLSGRFTDTLGTVYPPSPVLLYVYSSPLLLLGHTTWTAAVSLAAARTIRMQAWRHDQTGGLTFGDSRLLSPTFQALRLGD